MRNQVDIIGFRVLGMRNRVGIGIIAGIAAWGRGYVA